MPLTLTIRNATRLENGSPLSLVLDRRGAMIGRAATTDWCLPDPTLHVSSRHCEVRFSGGQYELVDHSTNGTFVDGQQARLAGPHMLSQGDVIRIGPFEIVAALDDAAASLAAERNSNPVPENWKGWTGSTEAAAPPASSGSWDARPVGSAISGTGPMSQNWAAPPTAAPPTAAASPAASGWGPPAVEPPIAPPPAAAPISGWGNTAPPEPSAKPGGWGPASSAAATPVAPAQSVSGWGAATPPSDTGPASSWGVPTPAPMKPASEWSSPAAAPPPPGADDIWGKFAQSNVVDWARGGFGGAAQPATPAFAPPPPPPIAVAPPPVSPAMPVMPTAPDPYAAPAPAPVAPPAAAPVAAPVAPQGASIASFANGAGIGTEKLQAGEAQTLGMAGNLLRRLVAGMVVMLEARARAKSQLGAQGTSLEFDGNNPLKFARTPEQALEQLLNVPHRGFMDSERAIEDAFKDLQAHQMATLKAMQGALRATLDRFSPRAIRARAEQGGFLTRILPGARDAALWAAYEKEFSGVAQGSDEAFMEMFAKEFRRAYEEIANQR
ncbi:type VI secretion system-associated FHA domain protein TagH [Novosphingobium sp.]|uniref:type VI secretion system-associated FHA domain protein TagH n=1 Tax=Novosphingobium sp. TaxID=1874826 RepID=UPI00262385A6|nr:type VI secretion system-associated FHA domain protein TagH [Novosphingobium sp.]